MIDEVWGTDRKVLVEIVRQLRVDGLDFANLDAAFEKAGVDPAAGNRSVETLVNTGLLDGSPDYGGGWTIGQVTERGLIKAGAWPDDTERLAAQIVAALNEAAEREPEPEKRSKFAKAASAISDIGTKVVGETLAAYAGQIAS